MIKSEEKDQLLRNIKSFMDFEKSHLIFYYNIFLDDLKIVIKIPIARIGNDSFEFSNIFQKGIKIDPFNLAKYTFLFNYRWVFKYSIIKIRR